MCGIAGAVGFIDAAVLEALRRSNDVQRHRGPDAVGFWCDVESESSSGVALAHSRLAIIDLSDAANQPMLDPESGNVISYNGEIYNFRELREELKRGNVRFRTDSDTELALKAYASWQGDAVRRFRGMFAFAIWDAKERTLCLARDRLGVKPLYLAQLDRGAGRQTLVFASELRTLLETGLVERRAHETSVASYLWNGFVVGPDTIIAGIRLFPAGSHARIDARNLKSSEIRYWQIPAAPPQPSEPDAVEAELAESVRMRLISDVPLAIFLSGGIDSSAVANLAARASARRAQTFTIGFEEAGFDESGYARRVADALGTEHHEIRLRERDFNDHLPDALDCLDQPTFDALNTYFISRAVHDSGIKVALAGIGGDELFGGYRSFLDIPRAMRWSRRLSACPEGPLRAAAALATRLRVGRYGRIPPQTRYGKLGDALSARGDLVSTYQVTHGLFSSAFHARLWRGGSSQVRAGLPSIRFEELAEYVAGNPLLHAISMLELSLFVGERLLRDTDAASMAVSLEVRVPLLDHRLIEMVSSAPEAERFGPPTQKQMLRRVGLRGLPPELFDRPKAGFQLPIEHWCRKRLRGEVGSALQDSARCESLGLDPSAVHDLWHAFDAHAPGIYWSRVWALFVVLEWCRRHQVRL